MKSRSLKVKVYKSLRDDIVSGKIKAGTRVTENQIAASLNVSRTPVREALQKLVQEYFLIAIPKAGYLVEDLSDDQIQDLFTTRMEIEQIAARKAVQYITAEELKQLDDNLEQTKAAIKSGNDATLTELDVEFHTIIYTAARSRELFRICKNLNDMTMKYRHGLNLTASLQNEMLSHHINIYQAIITKNEQLIIKGLATHGESANTHLIDMMKKIRSESFNIES